MKLSKKKKSFEQYNINSFKKQTLHINGLPTITWKHVGHWDLKFIYLLMQTEQSKRKAEKKIDSLETEQVAWIILK